MSDLASETRSRQSPVVGRSYARGQMYGLLSMLVAYPDRELVDRVAALAPRSLAAARYLRFPEPELSELLPRITPEGIEALEQSYQASFTLSYSPDVPAYEVGYISSDVFRQTEEMADIAGFYRAFGADVSEARRERVDHIAVELSFMQLLCLKEAYAAEHREAGNLRLCRRAQRAFLRDHLLCWGPALAERLSIVGGASVHGSVGRVLVEWLRREATSLGVEPRRTYDRPLPPAPEPEAECEKGGSVIPLSEIG